MNDSEKKVCLSWVREVIQSRLMNREASFRHEEPGTSSGAFVTLHMNGELRGCVGMLQGTGKLLSEVLREAAISAAFKDPRFPPLTNNEYDLIDVEISLLSPFSEVASPSDIHIGKHGVLLNHGYHSALFLPQVATEQGWSLEQFLSHLCVKAGLPHESWRDKEARFRIFTAEVFSEQDFF